MMSLLFILDNFHWIPYFIVPFEYALNIFAGDIYSKQKQPPRGVVSKSCSENMQQIYRRTPMPKCDFNKVALQLRTPLDGCFWVKERRNSDYHDVHRSCAHQLNCLLWIWCELLMNVNRITPSIQHRK